MKSNQYIEKKHIVKYLNNYLRELLSVRCLAHASATFNVKAAISKKWSKFNSVAKPLIG